jgi:hypothetical protein
MSPLEAIKNRESGCHGRPVSHDQICQCKPHDQCRNPFGQPSIPRFSVSEHPLDAGEDILDFCANGGFLTLPALELPHSEQFLICDGWTTVDLVPNLLALLVFEDGSLALLRTSIILLLPLLGEPVLCGIAPT